MNTAKGESDYSNSVHRRNHEEYVGKQFGRWTIVEILPELSANGSVLCRCRCSCENHTEKVQILANVRSGKTKSCGCERNEKWSERHTIDLTGQVINDITVLYLLKDKRYSDGTRMWRCRCNRCGTEFDERSTSITHGLVKMCRECARKKNVEAVKKAITLYTDEERDILGHLRAMLKRCENQNSDSYKWYGAKGITVCPEWHDKRTFINWAVSHGYQKGLTIERIDITKGYCPENCKWITLQEQARNRSNNHCFYVNGVRYTKSQCAEIIGMEYARVAQWQDKDIQSVMEYRLSPETHNRPHPFLVTAEKVRLKTYFGRRGITV